MFISAFIVGCSANLSAIEEASRSYKQNKNYASLEIIHKNISKGMQRKQVENLLGEPDYSPVNGQYYYSSDQSSYVEEQERQISIGLVVDYRDNNNVVTKSLENYWLGPIGE
jgi:outer membrane protein assembly factor BamE (lipoprotein component of BamABCDE complex)